ncbi:ATP-dependent endonuclease [Candidatus Saccharibacteria bacterium]|nr:MAG: ATP-dependent endonuclease [Candidatus Saccharibacteria bacterium]
MIITEVQVQNYRLLKDFSISLEDELSLVVGKNNCGKTSLLSVMDKFLNSSSPHPFSFNDFNLGFLDELKKIIENDIPENYRAKGIALKLFINYDEGDNLANISKLMMDLDPENNKIVLLFEYILTIDDLNELKGDFAKFTEEKQKDLSFFLKDNYKKYFKLSRKTVDPTNNEKFIDLEREKISLKNVINYKFIKANRDVSNKDSDKSLSSLSSNIYEQIETSKEHQAKIDDFKETLQKTDNSLNDVYSRIFEDVTKKVERFGGIKENDTKISITSTLQHKDLLKGNTTVLYTHGSHELPENYNGLGYMNLINMIFEIEIKVKEFKKEKEESPADINLLFIEEPEAHTHPQMQYIFIKNIKDLLKDGVDATHKLQYIVSTHSPHIVSESDFDDIKYLKLVDDSIVARNLKDLEYEYKNDRKEQNYKFLKQYLTLHRAELFFADKAIFIEGDTERILLPAMMKKVDLECSDDKERSDIPLLSQNISIVETGNYSHIFEKFINFIGVKSLIITDIDSADGNGKKCPVTDPNAKITTNASLKFFYKSEKLGDFKDETIENMVLKKDDVSKEWAKAEDGLLVCVYQTNEKNSDDREYHARSFEDSFFHINRQFIIDNKTNFESLKNVGYFEDESKDSYELSTNCVDKKPSFAIEILLTSEISKDSSDWKIPDYIKQGLLWLREDQN